MLANVTDGLLYKERAPWLLQTTAHTSTAAVDKRKSRGQVTSGLLFRLISHYVSLFSQEICLHSVVWKGQGNTPYSRQCYRQNNCAVFCLPGTSHGIHTLLSFGIFPSASSLARACLLLRMRWYCLAFTYRGSSSSISAPGKGILWIAGTEPAPGTICMNRRPDLISSIKILNKIAHSHLSSAVSPMSRTVWDTGRH